MDLFRELRELSSVRVRPLRCMPRECNVCMLYIWWQPLRAGSRPLVLLARSMGGAESNFVR